MNEHAGFRGYNGSRPIRGVNFPQRVQNLVIRDYAARNSQRYLLSATEYAMPGCYMILEGVLEELPSLAGIIAFSAFLLPARKARRLDIYERILSAGCELHLALEGIGVRSRSDIAGVEDLIEVVHVLPGCPFGGRYEKGLASGPRTSSPWSAFLLALNNG